MPNPAVKPELPPPVLSDRSEGWGTLGKVQGYQGYIDDGIWMDIPVRQSEFQRYPSECSDGTWSHEILES